MKVHQQKLRVVYLPPEGVVEEEPDEIVNQSKADESRVRRNNIFLSVKVSLLFQSIAL